MPDSRWRSSTIPAVEAFLLLPGAPPVAHVTSRLIDSWAPALRSWGIPVATGDALPHGRFLAVVTDAEVAAAHNAQSRTVLRHE